MAGDLRSVVIATDSWCWVVPWIFILSRSLLTVTISFSNFCTARHTRASVFTLTLSSTRYPLDHFKFFHLVHTFFKYTFDFFKSLHFCCSCTMVIISFLDFFLSRFNLSISYFSFHIFFHPLLMVFLFHLFFLFGLVSLSFLVASI